MTDIDPALRALETYIIRAGTPSLGPTWQEAMEALDGLRLALAAAEAAPLDAKTLADAIWNVCYPGEEARNVMGEAGAIAVEYQRLAAVTSREGE